MDAPPAGPGERHRPTWPAAGAAALFGVTAVAGTCLSVVFARGGDIFEARWEALHVLAAWALVWAAGVIVVFRMPRRAAVAATLAAGIALRLAALAGPPVLSDDLYRYSWDGRAQAAGVNPYLHPPLAPELAGLREPWLWPDEQGCRALSRPPGCTRMNRPAERTIYPPLAQAWFAAAYRLGGIDAQHKLWQVAGLLGEVALLGLAVAALRAWGRNPRWVALYALSPVPVVEVVNNGHVDGVAAALVVAALVVAARHRPTLAGALLGAAALVKLYPVALIVGLAGLATGRRPKAAVLAKAGGAAVAMVAAGYLPHVLSAGPRVLGYLPGYLREEGYDAGTRYLLAGLVPGPAMLATALASLTVVATVIWAVRAGPEAPVPARFTVLMGVLLLAATPVQPWYAVVLLAMATVAVAPVWAAVALAAYPLFFAVILDAPGAAAFGRWGYGLAAAAVGVCHLVTRPRPRPGNGDRGPAATATIGPRRWSRAHTN
ncbi:MAG: glycosyltransferase 87 family protein [Actinomycetota bacterium]